uniref:Forkhead box O6 a n=1 Tax=Tetraodon nigroviridis TaxID=99883 RepID=H3CCE5_TETNG
IRVQNEGTGKSSWWMLNPDGGKMGKAPRRRAVSMDSNTKYLKSKGRIRGKRAGRGLQSPPDVSSSPQKGLSGPGGASGTDGDFDTWSDLHSRASSSASTLSGRLSPILAEGEPEKTEEGLSCSTSPQLYPSPTSARSPPVVTGKNCPPFEQLPQLTNLTATISLDEHLNEDGYHHQPPQQHHQQHSSVGRHKQQPFYHYSPVVKSPYSAGGYSATGMGIICHHSPMQTIQENKPTSFSGTMQAYSSTNALQSLLIGGPAGQQYCSKGTMPVQKRESHSLMGHAGKGVGSNHHSHRPCHSNGCSHNRPSSHSHNRTHSHAHNHNVNNHNSPHSLTKSGHNLSHNHTPPHPVSLTTNGNGNQSVGNGTISSNYHDYHQSHFPERLPADLDIDMFNGSLDCDVESILLHDIMNSGEELDFNFDSSLAQGVGIGMGMGVTMGIGIAGFSGPQQTHSNQSWVSG